MPKMCQNKVYVAGFIQSLLSAAKKKLASQVNFNIQIHR